MAAYPYMVYRALGYAIIVTACVGACLYILQYVRHPVAPLYSATNPQLDLAVVQGIAAEEKIRTPSMRGISRAVIVPHHLVVPESIARGVREVSRTHPRIVVVVSPDHYKKCHTVLCTTYGSFTSFFGVVHSNRKIVQEILLHTRIASQSDLFTTEHGVYSIVPFIAHYISGAEIVPITLSIRNTETEEERRELVEIFTELLASPDIVLVVSSDFSHYLPLAESNIKDNATIDTLCSADVERTRKLQSPEQSDCPLCLWVAESVAQAHGYWNPVFLTHTNAAEVLHDVSAQETTSHFTIAIQDEKNPTECGALLLQVKKY
jgi:AmmeMemoRadiSam system protein B